MNMAVGEALTDQGWQASLELGFAPRLGRTALVHRRQRGPLAVQRPFYPEGEACHLYLLHPPGGVVGGDSLQISAKVTSGAQALVTTPGATKFYFSTGKTAHQRQVLHIDGDASLEWLPQENIFFPGALAQLQTKISLTPGARFIGWESHCLGKPATGERFHTGALEFSLQVELDNRPLLLDRLNITPERLDGAAGLSSQPVTATLLATPAGQEEVEMVRELAEEVVHSGVTLLDDLLVLRYLGVSTEQCRKLFTQTWAAIRPTVIGRMPCPPRIWST